MKIRDLTISDSWNLNGCREFNHLRVNNIDEFLEDYKNNLDYYKAPFEILADLEAQIKFENNPPESVLCEYKEWGDIIFRLVGITESDDVYQLRLVTYTYDTSIS